MHVWECETGAICMHWSFMARVCVLQSDIHTKAEDVWVFFV